MPSSSSAQAKYEYIPVTKLRFDPGNPRFFGSKKDKLKNQDELYRELINSFGALGLVVTLPRFYRHLHKGEHGEIGGAPASKHSTSVCRGL